MTLTAFDGAAREAVVSGKFGRIWSARPTALEGAASEIARFAFKSGGAKPGENAELEIEAVAFAPGGGAIAAVDEKGRVYVLHVTSNRFVQIARVGYAGTAIAFSTKNKKRVYVGFEDGCVRAFDTENSSLLATLKCLRGHPKRLEVSSCGTRLISASPDALHLWNLRTMKREAVLDCKSFGCVQARLVGDRIVNSFQDGSTFVWHLGSLSQRKQLELPGLDLAPIKDVVVTPSERFVVAGGYQPYLCVWSLRDGSVVKGIRVSGGEGVGVEQLSTYKSSDLIVALCTDDAIRIIDVAKGMLMLKAPIRGPKPKSFAVDKKGNYAAVALENGRMTVVDLTKAYQLDPARDPLDCIRLPTATLVREDPGERGAGGAEGGEGAAGNAATAAKQEKRSLSLRAKAAEEKLARKKLKRLLDTYGEYPSKYRVLIWKQVLQLPSNANAYAALHKLGVHKAFAKLDREYPITDHLLYTRLQNTLSCLTHWTPLFHQVSYLPAFVFPFVQVFGSDEMSCFEAVVTVFTNLCCKWFEMFPGPPLPFLAKIEDLLIRFDPELARKMARVGGVQVHAWTLLQSAFSEVLSRHEWLKLWDHFLSGPPIFMQCFVSAFMIYFRGTIMSAPNKEELHLFLRRSEAVDVNQILLMAYELKRSCERDTVWKLSPLKKGDSYPIFSFYPEQLVNFQINQYERLSTEEEDLRKRRHLVDGMERQRFTSKEQIAERTKHNSLAQAASEHKAKVFAMDERLFQEKIRLDEMEKAYRIQQLEDMERMADAAMVEQEQAYQKELEALNKQLESKQRMLEYEVKSKLEYEAINKLEFEANKRKVEAENQATMQKRIDTLKTEVENKASVLELQRQNKIKSWKAEDDEDRLKEKHRLERARQMARMEEESNARVQALSLVNRAALEGEAELRKVEFERRKRKLEAEETKLNQQAMEAEQQREAIAVMSIRDAFDTALEEQNTWLGDQRKMRDSEFSEVLDTFHKIMEGRRKQLSDLRRTRIEKEQQADFAEKFRNLEIQNSTESQSVDSLVKMLLLEQRKDLELSMQLEAEEKLLGGRADFLAQLSRGQAKVELGEKHRFNKAKELMVGKASKLEADLRRRHQDVFAKLKFERERMISELEIAWRKKASAEELRSFKESALSYKDAQKKLFDVYAKMEQTFKMDLERTKNAKDAKEAKVAGPTPQGEGGGGESAREDVATEDKATAPISNAPSASDSSAAPERQKRPPKAPSPSEPSSSSTHKAADAPSSPDVLLGVKAGFPDDISLMTSSDSLDYLDQIPYDPDSIQDYELPTSGSETSLGSETFPGFSVVQKEATDLVSRHKKEKGARGKGKQRR